MEDVKDTEHAVLHRRAVILAAHKEAPARTRSIQVLEFTVGGERYAFETTLVNEVYPVRELAVIPGVPDFVLGIVSVRGRIVSVLDLRSIFGAPEQTRPPAHPVIILRSVAMEFAVAADAVSEVRQLPESAVQRSLASVAGVREEYLLGVTPDGVVVLDAARLLADRRLVVDDIQRLALTTKGTSP